MLRSSLFAVLLLTLTGCAQFSPSDDLQSLSTEMSRAEVLAMLGSPTQIHRQDNIEAWEYCRVGYVADDYVLVWLRDGRVIGSDARADWEFGHCKPDSANFDWANVPT